SGTQTIYSTSTSLALSHVAFADAAGESGIGSNTLTVATAALTNDTCGTFGSASATSDGTITATAQCYQFVLTGTDNVGNSATVTLIVKVDPTNPTISLTPSAPTGGVYYSGSGTTLWFRPGAANGGFTLTAAPSDPNPGTT